MNTTREPMRKRPSLRRIRFSGSVRIVSLDREAALREVRQAAERLARQHPEVEEVILFGSLASGTAGPASDADLLVVLRDSELAFPQRIARYLPDGCRIAVDLFPYTRGELEQVAAEGRRLVKEAIESGIRLFPRVEAGAAS